MNKKSKFSLKNEIFQIGRHGAVYGVAEILSRVVGFLMIPVYTHYLNPTDYGVYELVGLTIEVFGIVLGLGIADAVFRFYFDTTEIQNKNLVISTASIGVTIMSFFALSTICLFSVKLAGSLLESKDQALFIILAIGTLWFNQQVNFVYTYLRVNEFSGKYMVLSLAKLVMALSLNIYFVVFQNMGVFGIFISNLITAIIFSIATFPLMLKTVGLSFSWPIAKKMLRFSLPVIPANLATLAVNASDRFFVRAFFSIADAGIYSLGYKLGNVVFYLVRVPLMQIWEPRRYKLYDQGAPAEIYAKVTTYFTGIMIFIGLGISVFIQDIIKIISPPDYWSAATYVPAVVVCYIVYALDNHVAFGILTEKKTEYWTYVNLVMGGINLVLNFVLIPQFGIWGAVLATFFSLVFKIVALHIIARRFFRIPFEWYRMGSTLTLAAATYFASVISHPSELILALAFDSFMMLLFLSTLWILGVDSPGRKKYFIDGNQETYERRIPWTRFVFKDPYYENYSLW